MEWLAPHIVVIDTKASHNLHKNPLLTSIQYSLSRGWTQLTGIKPFFRFHSHFRNFSILICNYFSILFTNIHAIERSCIQGDSSPTLPSPFPFPKKWHTAPEIRYFCSLWPIISRNSKKRSRSRCSITKFDFMWSLFFEGLLVMNPWWLLFLNLAQGCSYRKSPQTLVGPWRCIFRSSDVIENQPVKTVFLLEGKRKNRRSRWSY